MLRLLACLLLTALLPAQDDGAHLPGKRTVVCGCGFVHEEYAPLWLAIQADDGHFPATWHTPGGDDGGLPDRDLRVTALTALWMLADGSTLGDGPHQAPLTAAVTWLRSQQDTQGRIGPHARQDWILDHAMSAYALCEAARTGEEAGLRDAVGGAIAVLIQHLRGCADGADPELLVWCRMNARSASAFDSWARRATPQRDEPAWDSGAARLETEVARLTTDGVPAELRGRAARFLLESLAADGGDEATLARLASPFVATGWPAQMDDPLAVLYAFVATYRTGPEPSRAIEERLTELVVKTQVEEDCPLRGSWAPRGAFGREYGRAGTTAAHLILLTVYYRYSVLDLAH